MKKLLFITTGGTVACENTAGGLAPHKSGRSLADTAGDICEADVLELYSIDSTDVSAENFRMLYKAVTENLSAYDGIVILHGTDTMAYSCAVLAFTVDTAKPVVFTGSMLSPGEEGSDAQENIRFAAKTACSGEYPGVRLAFCGKVIGGADVIKLDSRKKDGFGSYSGYTVKTFFPFPDSKKPLPALIKLTPFTQPCELAPSGRPVVLETYGAGGIPLRLMGAVKKLSESVRLLISTPCAGGTALERYEVGRRALSLGIENAKDMSTECMLIYLWLSQTDNE